MLKKSKVPTRGYTPSSQLILRLCRILERLKADSARCTELTWTPEEQILILKLIKPESFDVWRKAIVPIIVILSYLEVNTEVSNDSMKIREFGKYKKLLEFDGVTNKVLVVIYSRVWFFYKNI